MKVTYTVDIGETFHPPRLGLAPLNFDATKHEVFLGKEPSIEPSWNPYVQYRLELKKVRTSKYFAYNDIGGVIFGCSLIQAWHWVWTKGRTTKFVIEHVYEDNILIDMIVHKSPKG